MKVEKILLYIENVNLIDIIESHDCNNIVNCLDDWYNYRKK